MPIVFTDPDLVSAGFSIAHLARIEFNYTSKDDAGAVRNYPVSPSELKVDKDLDALVLQVLDIALSNLCAYVLLVLVRR